MDMPPRGTHVWRQCITLAVARNFYQEDMNILRPRVDRREDQEGVTGMQFPSYEYAVAVGYKVFGDQDWVARLVQFLFFSLSIWGFFRLVRILTDSAMLAALAAWLYSWSPELFYHGINALPDILALGASLWGFYFLFRYLKQEQWWQLAIGVFVLILAGATKIQYLAVGGGILVAWLLKINRTGWKTRDFGLLLAGVIILCVSALWYFYAVALTKSSGLAEFGLHFRTFPALTDVVRILHINLQMDVPETLLGFGTFGAFVIGVYHVLSRKLWATETGMILSGWFLVLLVYHMLELSQMEVHQYYMIPHIPIMMMVAGFGLIRIFRSKWKPLALAVLVAAPILAGVRIIPARWMDRTLVHPSLYDEQTRSEIIEQIPKGKLAITGSDRSNCVYMYYLRTKGFGFNEDWPLDKPFGGNETRIENFVLRGAEVLVSDQPASEIGAEPWIEKEVAALHGFWIYELKRGS